jgi:L-alanine-DL-glutamate epimerase-like enolase superfamily enzyme
LALKITEIRTATVVGNYYWTFVRVYAGDEWGTGEGFFAPRLEGVIGQLGRVIIGEDALRVNRLLEHLRWAAAPSGLFGVNCHAITALEIAVLDLVGKHLNVPVHQLLGGALRDRVRLYVDTHAGKSLEAVDEVLVPTTPRWMEELGARAEGGEKPLHGRVAMEEFTEDYTPEAYGRRAREMKAEGYTAIKFDLDVPTPYTKPYNLEAGALTNQEIEYLASLVGAVREAVGEDTDIMFDLHWRLNTASAIRLARALERFNPMWVEDPVPPWSLEAMKAVAQATTAPIATGENLYTRYEFAPLLETGIRVAAPDALKVGGLLETRFIGELAAIREITVSPHNIGSPLGTMAQAHVAATLPNFGVLEFHGRDVPIWPRLVKRPIIEQGFIPLPEEPGLGVELDEQVAARYALGDRFEL